MEYGMAPSDIPYQGLVYFSTIGSGAGNVSKEVKPFEEMRLHTILETVQLRKEEGNAYLEKTEFRALVEWRAHRAKTYSFTAFEQEAKNSIKDIRELTSRAFKEYESNKDNTNIPIKTIRELIGVPLETATLILSTYDPENLPYFSDDLDRYVHWEEVAAEKWEADKNVSHSMKEYSTLCERISEIRSHIKKESGNDIRAIDIEMAARELCYIANAHIKLSRPEAGDTALVPEEKPRKRRKTQSEIWEEEHPRGSENDQFKHIHITVDKGRDGSPVYDEFGIQMDYDKYVDWERPKSYRPSVAQTERMHAKFKKDREDFERTAVLMDDKENFDAGNGEGGRHSTARKQAYMERVQTDLQMNTDHVNVEDFEEWHKKGFRAREREFDMEKWDEKKIERYSDMLTGGALRK